MVGLRDSKVRELDTTPRASQRAVNKAEKFNLEELDLAI